MSAWRAQAYDDSSWISGQAPIGYGEVTINTTLMDMQGGYSTVFLRKSFVVSDLAPEDRLRLSVDYDDGFIVWINGIEVLRRNVTVENPAFDSLAADNYESTTYEDFDLALPAADLLQVGDNVLAVQVFNRTVDSSDCKIDAELVSYRRVADTTFSRERGFYDSAFNVTIATVTPGATIRYTTTGTPPTLTYGTAGGTNVVFAVNRTLCLRAAAFRSGYEPTDVATATYVFLNDVLTQTRPSGYPLAWGTNSIAADYDMDPNVVNDAAYSGVIEAGLESIPTLSIVATMTDLFGSQGSGAGIYGNGSDAGGNEAEIPVSVELLYPAGYPGGTGGFRIDAGLKAHANPSAKRSLELVFTGTNAPAGPLVYPVFESAVAHSDSAAGSFKRLVLRAGENDLCFRSNQLSAVTYARDQWARDSFLSMTGFGARGTHVHLYLNGLYWGVYTLVERPDHTFSAAYRGGDDDDWFAADYHWEWGPALESCLNGDSTRWKYLHSALRQSDLSISANYSQLQGYLNVTRFCDYVLLHWYAGASFFPPKWFAAHRTDPIGPADYHAWDLEQSWADSAVWGQTGYSHDGAWVHPAFFDAGNPGYARDVPSLFRALQANADFKALLADRIYRHGYNNGALDAANASNRWLAICTHIEGAMIGESARWGDGHGYGYLWTRNDHWAVARDYVAALMDGNGGRLRDECRTRGLYPVLDPPAFHQHGGAIAAGFMLTMVNPNGAGLLYYTSDGTDPRLSGGGIAGTAIAYGGAFALAKTTYVKARVYKSNSTWSAAHAATYNYTAHYSKLRITELMYNPPGDADDLEFVEIRNTGTSTRGLSEMYGKGIAYTFEPGAELAAGEFALLVRDEAAFTNRYPGVRESVAIFGVYAGKLHNGGEKVALLDCEGRTVVAAPFTRDFPWPGEANGLGYSLVAVNPDADLCDPSNWRASNLIGGSPGYDEGAACRVVVNEALTHTDLPYIDAIELYNEGAASADIGGWYLSDSAADYWKFRIPDATVLPAFGYLVFDEDDFNTDTNDPACFGLGSHGDEIYLTRWDASSNMLYLAQVEFGAAENGVSFGRYLRSDGVADFTVQTTRTLGSANADPKFGPVVINEVMYHPADGEDEFIELHNSSESTVKLYDQSIPSNTWKVAGGVDYVFPAGIELAPGEIALVVGTSAAAFRTKYAIPPEIRIFGPYTGVLDNAGETIRLQRPDYPDVEGIPWIVVDRLAYSDDTPWPKSADGDGPSLERLDADSYGNDPVNWSASAASGGTPGAANSGALVPKAAGWKYHDRGQDLGTAWRQPAYDDSGWSLGHAPLGYEVPDALNTVVSYGDNPENKHITTYFRKSFTLAADPANVTNLTLQARYDDGFVAYLNGQEVVRSAMPGGTVSYTTCAFSHSPSDHEAFDLSAQAGKLTTGVNVLAVELHQSAPASADLFMDVALTCAVSHGTPPAAPVNLTASAVSSTQISLIWTDCSSNETGFKIDRRQSGFSDWVMVASVPANQTAVNDTGLPPSTLLYYKAKAYNSDGNSPYSNVDSATTYDGPPTAPSGLAVAAQSTTRVVLSWIDNSANETGFKIERSPDGSSSWQLIDTVGSSVVTYGDVGLTAATSYYYRVRAYNGFGDSDYSNVDGATTWTLCVLFATSASTGSEAVSPRNADVVLSDGSAQAITVDYTATGGTATGGGTDYSLSSGTLTFAPGTTNQSVAVTIVDDQSEEGEETILVSLSSPVNATLGAYATHTLIITDNDAGFAAYNDLAWTADQTSTNITTYTRAESGLLVDYNTGTNTAVTLTVNDGGGGPYFEQGTNAAPATDAYAVFDGIVDCAGLVSYGSNLVLTFTGLDPSLTYELVLFGNRHSASYTDRTTQMTISDVDSWENTSTPGTEIYTTTAANDTTRIVNGYNTVNGYVARFSSIDPGTDGDMCVTVGDSDSKFYLNALKLSASVQISTVATPVIDPPHGTEFTNSVQVTLSTATAGATIYYTTDGTEPSNTSYSGCGVSPRVLMLSFTTTIKARAYKAGCNPSAIAAATISAVDASDADADGMPDAWEVANFGSTAADPAADPDSDGFTNLDEYVAGTDPDNPASFPALDLDASGSDLVVSWLAVQAAGTGYSGMTRRYTLEKADDPGAWSPVAGYSNILASGQTVVYSNALVSAARWYRCRIWLEDGPSVAEVFAVAVNDLDADADGLPDWWEGQHFGGMDTEPQADPDGDGLDNLGEYVCGTDPTDAGSCFWAADLAVDPASDGVVLRWPSVAGRTYALEWGTNLADGVFVVGATGIPATPPMNTYTDVLVSARQQMFYQIRTDFGTNHAYSVNGVGYTRVDLTPDEYNPIACQFDAFYGMPVLTNLIGSPLSAGDRVAIWDAVLQDWSYDTFTNAPSPHWVDGSALLERGEAFYFRSSVTTNLYLVGDVPSTAVGITLLEGLSLVSYPYPAAVLLQDTTLPAAGAYGAMSQMSADNIMIGTMTNEPPVSADMHDYWLFDSGGSYPAYDNKWIDADIGDIATKSLQPGEGAWYLRRGSGSFEWDEPCPYSWPPATASNPPPPTVNFASAASEGPESCAAPLLTLSLDAASVNSVSVGYAIVGGTASHAADYTVAGNVVFLPGQTQASIPITIADDAELEASETVVLQLTSAVNGVLGTNTQHTYTIHDNDLLFAAYNDLAWTNGQVAVNITTFSRGQSGPLLDYATGANLPVTLAINDGGSGPYQPYGTNGSGDASAVFDGIVDCAGCIYYGTDLTFTFSGLDPALRYQFVLFGNRGEPSYTDRQTRSVLSGATSFVNRSSGGAQVTTTAVQDDTTTIRNGWNTDNGYVAKYDEICPGPDGEIVITVGDADLKFYVNALMLKAMPAAPGYEPRAEVLAATVYSATGSNWANVDENYVQTADGWTQADGKGCFLQAYQAVGGQHRASLRAIPDYNGTPAATVADYTILAPRSLSTYYGLADGQTLGSVRFVIQVKDGATRTNILDAAVSDSDSWRYVECDLSAWQDKEVVVRFITDPNGPTAEDWAHWGEPKIIVAEAVSLLVAGSPVEHGTSSPYGYGYTPVIEPDMVVTNEVNSPADETNGTRYVCTGWTGTGSVPTSGAGNAVTFTMTEDSTLTWHWQTERFLDTQADPGGSVNVADGWHTNGALVSVTATPDAHGWFVRWTGDVPGGMETDNPLQLAMDSPRAVTAVFGSPAVARGATWRFRPGTEEASTPATAWREIGFDDAGWSAGPAPLGYGDGPYGTTLTDMLDTYSSLFLRREFTVADPAAVDALRFWVCYDDGFILWLNGEEITRQNVAGTNGEFVAYDGTALSVVDPTEWSNTLARGEFPVLNAGTNVLAVQGFNATVTSSDFTFDAELAVIEGQEQPELVVAGAPAEHGVCAPYAYGTNYPWAGSYLECSVSATADETNGTRYACAGWTGTGSVPAGGSSNTVSFTIATNSILTWQWGTERLLTVAASGNGTVDLDDGWYTNGALVSLTALPGSNAVLANWTGDVPGGSETDNPLALTMDQARAVTANFEPASPVALPTLAPAGGDFYVSVDVTIETTTPGATLFYTTDGGEPTTGSAVYAAPFTLTNTTTVRVRGYAFEYGPSDVALAAFTNRTPTVSFAAAAAQGGEPASPVNVAVALSGSSPQTVTVDYSAGGGTATGGGVDYSLAAGTLTFAPGQTNVSFAVSVVNDVLDEEDETIVFALDNAAGAYPGSPSAHTYTILDDETFLVAYNDLAWESGPLTNNITFYTRAESGPLLDYNTGENSGVTLAISDGGVGPIYDQGANADPGTAAHDVFDGKVDCVGLIQYGADLTFTLTGLEPSARYEFVLFGNRANAAYADRYAVSTISDVDYFENTSSGTNYAGPTDATVSICTGDNTTNGYVARFSNIDPGPDGDMQITVSDSTTRYYVNALMLRVTQLSTNVQFQVVGSPAEHGASAPYGYGVHEVAPSTLIAESTPSPADETNGTRYACGGWTGTGDIPASGSSNSVEFTIATNSTLTWHWLTEHELQTAAGPNGQVDVSTGWHTNGSLVAVTATASVGYCFTYWTGDVPAGAETNNPLSVLMDAPRSVTANFAEAAGVRYVSPGGAHRMPFLTWADAATNIQAAVDAAAAGDTVLVTNGAYALAARVVVAKAVTVRGAAGPDATVVNGAGLCGCFRLAHPDAMLEGLTITGGSATRGAGVECTANGTVTNCILTGNAAAEDGGGVYGGTVLHSTIASNSAECGGGVYGSAVRACVLAGNAASEDGGGAYGGIVQSCMLWGNTAKYGGGACESELANATVTGNTAKYGGGTFGGTARNTIVYFNTATSAGANYGMASYQYCCTTPNPSGVGCISDEPGLLSVSNPHLLSDSPCLDAGNNADSPGGTDIDGETRLSGGVVDIGCDEVIQDNVTGPLAAEIVCDYTNAVVGYALGFEAALEGRVTHCAWHWSDGSIITNRTSVRRAFTNVADHAVILAAWNDQTSVAATVTVHIVAGFTNYVASGGSAEAPYTSWATAATRIQDAVDAALIGGVVRVAPGTYDSGEYVGPDGRCRVGLYKPVSVQATNTNPTATLIVGAESSGGTNAVRCAYVRDGAAVIGFTLTNGWADSSSGDLDGCGGGVLCEANGAVSNCLVLGCAAAQAGGGIYGGTICNSRLAGNDALYGGGAYWSELANCLLVDNTANSGGGAYESFLESCTVSANDATDFGGGVYGGLIRNSIVWANTAGWQGENYDQSELSYCCTTPDAPLAEGLVTSEPLFMDAGAGDYRVQVSSPCVDAGVNVAWMFGAADLAGTPRILNGKVDIGAYELQFMASVHAFLEGAYDSGTHAMRATLSGNGAVPLTAPYAADPRTVGAIPAGVTDWVLLELRQGTNANPIMARSAFLRQDGALLAVDGTESLAVEASPGVAAYLVLKHRSHLAAMSAEPLTFTNRTLSYDFAGSAAASFGGSSAVSEVESGVWALVAGDADGDGEILAVDALIHETGTNATGYRRGDLDLDGIVTNEDLAVCWTPNENRATAVPDGETMLTPGLQLAPPRVTLFGGQTRTFYAAGWTGVVSWAFVRNPSGATLSALDGSNVLYEAGVTSSCIDVIECWDEQGRLARAYVNVIGAEDVASVGKSVIIAGRSNDADPLWTNTCFLANSAYNTLLYRGFSKTNLHYLSPELDQDVDADGAFDDVDAETSYANAAWSFTNWANGADNLFVYLVDHGTDQEGEGSFKLNPDESLPASHLDAWLDGLQNAYNTRVTLVIDCCYAGSLLDELSYAGPAERIVIASAGTNEPAYFVAGGLVSFSDAFFNGMLLGYDVHDSYLMGQEAMGPYQTSLYYDNGGGTLAQNLYIGATFVAGKDIPLIGSVCGNQLLNQGTTATLWAGDILSEYAIQRVWCHVVPPSHEPDPAVPVDAIPAVELPYDEQAGRYQIAYDGFSEQGNYKIIYYAMDEWNSVSLPEQRYVYQEGFDERVVVLNAGNTNSWKWPVMNDMAVYAYHTCLQRWFRPETIFYMSAEENQDVRNDGTNDWDALPSLANLGYAITNWASPAQKLTLYVIGENENGHLRLNDSDPLSAAVLDQWLDLFQTADRQLIVILEFADSGLFLADLAPPANRERITIASTSAKSRHYNLWGKDGCTSFSGFFFPHIFNGFSVGKAFNEAQDGVRRELRGQNAELDDTGDGVARNDEDGSVAERRYIGAAFRTAGESPVIGAVMPDAAINENTNSVLLWAAQVTDSDDITNVWCAVSPPGYAGDSELPETNLVWNAAEDRYEQLYSGFTEFGTYTITFHAQDTLLERSIPVQADVVRLEQDSDADGMPDVWEETYFAGTTNADSDADSDSDGYSNYQEWLAGACPTSAASVFQIAEADPPSAAAGPLVLRWTSVSNRVYSVDFRTNLLSGEFVPLITDMYATPPVNTFTDTVHQAEELMFYRIRVGPAD
ncbi:MAG: chitobiase/beta-hexosaminidase C-terminal domain-containing protein [Kiritimatiellae bacterium]|nr:chitobiase/beta-hexosaminidase C-terminal domain-containing protein [Kiritimatiellia bacterium]